MGLSAKAIVAAVNCTTRSNPNISSISGAVEISASHFFEQHVFAPVR